MSDLQNFFHLTCPDLLCMHKVGVSCCDRGFKMISVVVLAEGFHISCILGLNLSSVPLLSCCAPEHQLNPKNSVVPYSSYLTCTSVLSGDFALQLPLSCQVCEFIADFTRADFGNMVF